MAQKTKYSDSQKYLEEMPKSKIPKANEVGQPLRTNSTFYTKSDYSILRKRANDLNFFKVKSKKVCRTEGSRVLNMNQRIRFLNMNISRNETIENSELSHRSDHPK